MEIIERIANDLISEFGITKETKEAFLENNDFVFDVEEKLKGSKGVLQNFESCKQEYIDAIIDKIDEII